MCRSWITFHSFSFIYGILEHSWIGFKKPTFMNVVCDSFNPMSIRYTLTYISCSHSHWTDPLYSIVISFHPQTYAATMEMPDHNFKLFKLPICHWTWVDVPVSGFHFGIECSLLIIKKEESAERDHSNTSVNVMSSWEPNVEPAVQGACTATMCNRHMPPHVLRGVDANVTVSHRLCHARNSSLCS